MEQMSSGLALGLNGYAYPEQLLRHHLEMPHGSRIIENCSRPSDAAVAPWPCREAVQTGRD
jgi:hypothetical protein